jgi:hypothetical protein
VGIEAAAMRVSLLALAAVGAIALFLLRSLRAAMLVVAVSMSVEVALVSRDG